MIKRHAAALLVAAVCATGFAAQADPATMDQALLDYAGGRYLRAEEGLRIAAAQGDVRAQELLGTMYASGPELYPGIPHDRHEAAVWLERAARGGSHSARAMYCSLTRHAVTYRMRSAACVTNTDDSARTLVRK